MKPDCPLAMRRFVWIWLTLLGAFLAARAVVSALAIQRVDLLRGAALFQLVTIPALQAAVVWWVTRGAGKKPGQGGEDRAFGASGGAGEGGDAGE